MFNNDIDDDFPLNGGSEKLDKLFEENSLPDISFKFTGHKPTINRPKPSNNSVQLKVVFAKTVEAFQMKVSGYKSEGKVGLAIIGNDEHCYYQLYMYRSDEKKVSSCEINYQFSFLVQQYNYASFKDSHSIQWSVHFDKEQDLICFSREIALARWRSCQGVRQKLVQDAFMGNPDIVAKKTDIIKVSYKVYTLSPENTLHEEDGTKPFKSGPACAGFWETSFVGACVRSKKFVILPSNLTSLPCDSYPDGYHLVLEMELQEVTPPPSEPSPPQQPSNVSQVKKDEGESLPGRMAKIGYALPSLQPTTSEAPSVPDQVRSSSSTTSPNHSNQSLQPGNSSSQVKGDLPSFVEPCDVSSTSQFNVLFSEVRTNNSEIRMNINRVTDKVDSLLSKMDFVSQINNDVIPNLKKIQNFDGLLSKIVDQNSAMMTLLERSSPAILESTVNEVIQLKKRNAELESFLEVSRSTSQILQEKVADLTEKTLKLENVKSDRCSFCAADGSGDKKFENLESALKNLEEKNSSLFEETQQLQRQKKQLTSKITHLEAEAAEKDKKLAEFEEEISNLELKLNGITKSEKSNDIENIVKSLMNKLYKALKEELKDTTTDKVQLEKTLQSVLRDVTKSFLKSDEENINKSSDERSRIREESEQPSQILSSTPFCPSGTPLPIPRPRRPPSLPQSSPQSTLPCKEEECPSPIDKIDDTKFEKAPGNISAESIDKGSNFIIADKEIINEPSPADSISFLAKEMENSCVNKGSGVLSEIENSPKTECSSESTTSVSSIFSPYSSTYYTPLFPTSPPPITDDGSD